MNIALIGYGKMGQAIAQYIENQGKDKVVATIDIDNPEELKEKKDSIDVAIEFTMPEVAVSNLLTCFELGIPVVCGTTGWLDQWDEVTQACKQHNGSLFYSSNYSIGVNIFWKIVKEAARLINHYEYQAQIDETHHVHKKDAPSGTAITTAQQVLSQLDNYNQWVLGDAKKPGDLPVYAHREDEVPGTHIVTFDNDIDTITIEHLAKSRQGFVQGAVEAAHFIANKTGVYSMDDLLQEPKK